MDEKKVKVALIVSHPIQHFCPQYESFAKNPHADFKVFFASKMGMTSYYDDKFKKEISWSNIRLTNFNHTFLNEQATNVGASLDAKRLDTDLSFFDPDIVIIYGYFQKFQRRAHKWAYTNKKVLAYISDSEFRHDINWVKKLLKWPFLKWYFSKINYFLSVGEANEEYYNYYGIRKSKLIRMHFPIDVSLYEKAWNNMEALNMSVRRRFNLKEDDFISCVVGKLVSSKSQDHIIEAMILLEERQKYLTLLIIGSGEMEEEWKQKAKKLKNSIVYFTGFVNPDELPAFYAACNVYIHPASIDAHTLAVSEAIYMGCPIILSDKCGSYGETDDVQVQKNGWVYKFGDINQLSGIIEYAMFNKQIVEKYSIYSHHIATQFQNVSHHISFEKLINMVNVSDT